MNVNPHLILLILSFLTDRHQIVKFNGHYSSNRTLSTGAPQGSVISPILFTLYTDDCRSSDPEMLYIKYSDDTVIINTTNSNNRISKEIHSFAGWCENYLDLNTSKTKEMLVYFRRGQPTAATLEVNRQTIERVEEYKYLGTTIDHKLTFKTNGELILSKCQQYLFFLRKMRMFPVQPSVLQAFYKSFVESNTDLQYHALLKSSEPRRVELRIARSFPLTSPERPSHAEEPAHGYETDYRF
ncbi:hypothetical protein SKAU_G00367350 [Synaphobranchus kaupii]|uniref:Reverse transcriptase domain-containing protein n=1 Tax=Synaphobranchus kaupii TaxID=118154 RepID=A0A9Q1IFJ6_SYNKA|nr:hypothetical protein SKAU_G00367350 [Synaphobranchus kaupii]